MKEEVKPESAPSQEEQPILCPICLHPIPYSKKFQCRRCGYMPG